MDCCASYLDVLSLKYTLPLTAAAAPAGRGEMHRGISGYRTVPYNSHLMHEMGEASELLGNLEHTLQFVNFEFCS